MLDLDLEDLLQTWEATVGMDKELSRVDSKHHQLTPTEVLYTQLHREQDIAISSQQKNTSTYA